MKEKWILRLYPFFNENAARFFDEMVCLTYDGVCELRAEQSGHSFANISEAYCLWRTVYPSASSTTMLYTECLQAWRESVLFALHTSLSIVSVEEKKKLWSMHCYGVDWLTRNNLFVSYVFACRLENIPWLEQIFNESGLRTVESVASMFDAALQNNRKFTKDHPYTGNKNAQQHRRSPINFEHWGGRSGS